MSDAYCDAVIPENEEYFKKLIEKQKGCLLRNTYDIALEKCYDKMLSRSNYGNEDDILKSIKELDIRDLGSMIKAKAIRIKNTDSKEAMEDNAIDICNYAIEILRRLEI
jgi:hypothetical protein